MTCEKPSESERPISHWSQREIADLNIHLSESIVRLVAQHCGHQR
jgi:hypothetical protein